MVKIWALKALNSRKRRKLQTLKPNTPQGGFAAPLFLELPNFPLVGVPANQSINVRLKQQVAVDREANREWKNNQTAKQPNSP
jgi:hypothetical protein